MERPGKKGFGPNLFILLVILSLQAPKLDVAASIIGPITLEKNVAWYKVSDTHTFSTFAYDVDDDGEIEILTGGQWKDGDGHFHGELIVWSWDGTTMFLEKCTRWSTISDTYVRSVFATDVDGDDQTEILTGGAYFDGARWRAQLIVWRWDSHTLTVEKVLKWHRIGDTQVNAVTACDVDGDSDIEIISAGTFNDGQENAQLLIWYWNGVTINIEKNIVWRTHRSTYLSSVSACDVNADGHMEILTGGWYELVSPPHHNWAQLRVWRWDGTTVTQVADMKWSDGDNHVNCVFASDIDGDGQTEILTAGDFNDGTRQQAQIVIWNGGNMAVEKKANWYYRGDTFLNAVCTGDIDEDGETEIVTGGFFYDGTRQIAQLVIWSWDGTTLVIEEPTKWLYSAFGGTCIASLGIADVDKDARIEMVTVGFFWDGTRWRAQLRIWSRYREIEYGNISVEQAKELIESNPSMVILDVRTSTEFLSGHIEGAINIPVNELQQRLDELDPNDEILVYCSTGTRSSQAMQILANNGFSRVYNMLGGIEAWKKAGYPIVQ